jgi:endonuclease/exonuclease/phosphatase family metal-dependent hydrolase
LARVIFTLWPGERTGYHSAMPPINTPVLALALSLSFALPCAAQVEPVGIPVQIAISSQVKLGQSFTIRLCVRMDAAPQDLPLLASNKAWESGEVRDYTTNNSFGLGRESGALAGFAISVLPDGAWTWNAGDGRSRIDHRPEAADQGIADGAWHEVGFAVDREQGVVHLFHDGRRVALHDLSGVGSMQSELPAIQLGESRSGLELGALRIEDGVIAVESVHADFSSRFGESRRPMPLPEWDGKPLRVLAWNIWHGGRRKGRDEGVQRVVDVINDCDADIVLMQETYGSGPRISGRLGFEYFLRSSNLSVMSRFPIKEVHRLGPSFRFGGATIQLRPGLGVQAYSLWINHLPSVQQQLAAGASAQELASADAKTRGSEMKRILVELLPHIGTTPQMPIVIGGDFNSGSHLDWTEAAAQLPNHHGRVVAWPVSSAMRAAGFTDTYRAAHSSPIEFPGMTWSPEFLESHQDRIDYVYVRDGAWEVLDSEVLSTHVDGWPSDHAAVLTTMQLTGVPNRINVMSYNIKHGHGNDGVVDLARAAAVIESVSPDVVTLQEVDEGCGRSGGIDQAAWLGERLGMHFAFGPFMDYDGGRYGMAVLSRLPIVSSHNIVLPPGAEPRSALAVRLQLADGSEVVVVGIHLYATAEQRLAQAKTIVAAFADEEAPVILSGDFNSRPGSPVMRLFEEQWMNPDKGEDRFTIPSHKPSREIDFIMYRAPHTSRVLRVDVMEEALVSDHRPLILELEVGS